MVNYYTKNVNRDDIASKDAKRVTFTDQKAYHWSQKINSKYKAIPIHTEMFWIIRI